jgi:hypothetical protein
MASLCTPCHLVSQFTRLHYYIFLSSHIWPLPTRPGSSFCSGRSAHLPFVCLPTFFILYLILPTHDVRLINNYSNAIAALWLTRYSFPPSSVCLVSYLAGPWWTSTTASAWKCLDVQWLQLESQIPKTPSTTSSTQHTNDRPTRPRAASLLLLRQLPHCDIPCGMANNITHPLQSISTNTQILGMV